MQIGSILTFLSLRLKCLLVSRRCWSRLQYLNSWLMDCHWFCTGLMVPRAWGLPISDSLTLFFGTASRMTFGFRYLTDTLTFTEWIEGMAYEWPISHIISHFCRSFCMCFKGISPRPAGKEAGKRLFIMWLLLWDTWNDSRHYAIWRDQAWLFFQHQFSFCSSSTLV